LIIVLADINEDVQGSMTQGHLKKLGLVEAMTKLHLHKLPLTHQHGQVPINGIFVMSMLMDQMSRGYMAFDDGMGSDHQGIWIDIPGQSLFRAVEQQFTPAKAHRLECLDPRVVAKYHRHLEEALKKLQIPQRIGKLCKKVQRELTVAQQHEYKAIDLLVVTAKLKAEQQC